MRIRDAFLVAGCVLLLGWFGFTPVDESIRRDPEVRHGMTLYRLTHTNCEWCGTTKKLEVHHIQPLWLNPKLAADTNNMIMLCKNDHIRIGHASNFGMRAVTNIRQLCEMRVIVERQKEGN